MKKLMFLFDAALMMVACSNEEIATNDSFLSWFSAETWAALDSTGNVAVADSDYLSDYYDNLRKVEEKRHWGD